MDKENNLLGGIVPEHMQEQVAAMLPLEGPPMPFFLAFSGKKQVGKDEATEHAACVLRKAGKNVAITAFAEIMKRTLCVELLGIDEKLVYGTDEDKNTLTHIMWDNMSLEIREKYSTETEHRRTTYSSLLEAFPVPRTGPMTVREVLQVIGTDIFRDMFGQDIWANAPFRKDWSEYDVVILCDCRFPNEKRVTEESGGVTIRLERDTGLEDTHASEIALDDVEFERKYVNDGTLYDLFHFVDAQLRQLNLI